VLDGDCAGREAAPRVASAIGPSARVLDLPEGLDPDDIEDPDLLRLVSPSLLS
jgi:DNA primase